MLYFLVPAVGILVSPTIFCTSLNVFEMTTNIFFLSTERSYAVLHHVFPSGGNFFPSIPISADFPIPDLPELCLHGPRVSQSVVGLSETRTS